MEEQTEPWPRLARCLCCNKSFAEILNREVTDHDQTPEEVAILCQHFDVQRCMTRAEFEMLNQFRARLASQGSNGRAN